VDKNGNLDTVTFSAWRVHEILQMFDELTDHLFRCANNTNRLAGWQRMLTSYMDVIFIAFQHKDFADEDIMEFQ
jgi:hypothetical protein